MMRLMRFQDRSEVIATYALCGFASFTSIGILVGLMITIAPHRKEDISDITLSAMISGIHTRNVDWGQSARTGS